MEQYKGKIATHIDVELLSRYGEKLKCPILMKIVIAVRCDDLITVCSPWESTRFVHGKFSSLQQPALNQCLWNIFSGYPLTRLHTSLTCSFGTVCSLFLFSDGHMYRVAIEGRFNKSTVNIYSNCNGCPVFKKLFLLPCWYPLPI